MTNRSSFVPFAVLLFAGVFSMLASSCKDIYPAPKIVSQEETEHEIVLGESLTLAPGAILNTQDVHFSWKVNGRAIGHVGSSYLFKPEEAGKYEIQASVHSKGGVNNILYQVRVLERVTVELPVLEAQPKTGEVFTITPVVKGPQEGDYKYRWLVDNSELGFTGQELQYATNYYGKHTITLIAEVGRQKASASMEVDVLYYVDEEGSGYSPHAEKRIAYLQTPFYSTSNKSGETFEEYYSSSLASERSSFRELGSWGSSITVAFDHVVPNYFGKHDFEITMDNTESLFQVEVAYDGNGNGQPDEDEWYTIKDEYYNHPEIVQDYSVTYELQGVPTVKKEGWRTTMEAVIAWSDNQGHSGSYTSDSAPGYHADRSTLKAVKHEGWATKTVVKGKMLDLDKVNRPEPIDKTLKIELSNAVDKSGAPIYLPGINFVRITNISAKFGQEGVLSGSDRIVNNTGFNNIAVDREMIKIMLKKIKEDKDQNKN